MKNRLLSTLILCGPLIAGQAAATKPNVPRRPSSTPEVMLPEAQPSAKVIHYSPNNIVRLRTKVRYTTFIQLPKDEEILDFLCGDKELWDVDGNQNFAYVKPAKAGAHTNLNLITASGNVYSFLLDEVSETGEAAPDLKASIVLNDEGMITALQGPRKFVSWEELQRAHQESDAAKSELRDVKRVTQDAIDRGVSQARRSFRHVYRFPKNKKPFLVTAMYRDEKTTFIEANPEETPILYEVKDGQPNLVNFQYHDGLFTVDKILDDGYLAIGKHKMSFTRQE